MEGRVEGARGMRTISGGVWWGGMCKQGEINARVGGVGWRSWGGGCSTPATGLVPTMLVPFFEPARLPVLPASCALPSPPAPVTPTKLSSLAYTCEGPASGDRHGQVGRGAA